LLCIPKISAFVSSPYQVRLRELVALITASSFPEDQTKVFAFARSNRLKEAKANPPPPPPRDPSGHRRHMSSTINVQEIHADEEAAPANLANERTVPVVDGWALYDEKEEFKRLMLDDANRFRIVDNSEFKLSPTYPRLFVVPASISADTLAAVCKFRSRARVPAISYVHPVTLATMSRSAQPMSGLASHRSGHDEELIRALLQLNRPRCGSFMFVDARGKLAATGNQAMGKGSESVDNYGKDFEMKFLDMENIHKVLRV
jgi:hypothetical protein